MITRSNVELNMASFVKDANGIKEIVLNKLKEHGHISESLFEEYTTNWNVIAIKAGWFTKYFKAQKLDENGFYYKYVNFS